MRKTAWVQIGSNALFIGVLIFGHAHLLATPNNPPSTWGDFKFGLVNDGKEAYNDRIKAAVAEGTQVAYRYAYVGAGVNPETNAISWLFSSTHDYVKYSGTLGVRPAFVIYMLQEDGGSSVLAANAQNADFMASYFKSVKIVAEKASGHGAVFVIEPDTWGYVLQDNIDPLTSPALVNNLGSDFAYLSDLPNNYSGLARGIIRTIKKYAPDAYAGILMSHWAPNAPGNCDPVTGDGSKGMPWRSLREVECLAEKNVQFALALLGNGDDRGDFMGVEKNGNSAGKWKSTLGIDQYYWGDPENANWLRWCEVLGRGVGLPVLGWQISIGHMGLPNVCAPGPINLGGVETGNCAYEDTFFPYFFQNVKSFIAAGFIGFLVGKGLADDTDYTHANKDPEMGDRGWFFAQLKEFDKGRPYLPGSTRLHGTPISLRLKGVKMTRTPTGFLISSPSLRGSPSMRDFRGRNAGEMIASGDKWMIDLKNQNSGVYWLKFQGEAGALVVPYF